MKQIFAITCILVFAFTAKAQDPRSVTLNLYGGYTFKDKVNLDNNYAYVGDGFQYGGGLEFFAQRNKSIELKYLRLDTDMKLFGPLGTQLNKDGKGAVNYILLAGNNYFGNNDKVHPYGGAGVGVGFVTGQNNSSAKFAWDAKLGVKINTSSAISLKLQAYVQSVISTYGSDYWVYPPGFVVAYPDYATLFQFGLGGAICFDFRKK